MEFCVQVCLDLALGHGMWNDEILTTEKWLMNGDALWTYNNYVVCGQKAHLYEMLMYVGVTQMCRKHTIVFHIYIYIDLCIIIHVQFLGSIGGP